MKKLASLFCVVIAHGATAQIQDIPNFVEDRPELIHPLRNRSEQDIDRLVASALIAEARLLYQREDFQQSLNRYERAFQYSHAKSKIVAEIIPIAMSVGRFEEAVQYSRLVESLEEIDPFALRRLAMFLTENRRFGEAIRLYEAVFEPDETSVVANFELGRLYFLTNQSDKAARAFEIVAKALQDPKQFDLEEEDRNSLLARPEITYGVIAESFLMAGRHAAAEQYFQVAFEASKNRPLHVFNKARVEFAKKNYKLARQRLNEYFETRSTDAGIQAITLLKDIIATQVDDKATAQNRFISRLEHLNKENSADYSLGYYLANAYIEDGRPEKAEPLYIALMRKHPLLDGAKALLKIYTDRGDADKLYELLVNVVAESNSTNLVREQISAIVKNKGLATKIIAKGLRSTKSLNSPQNLILAKIALQVGDIKNSEILYQASAKKNGKPQLEAMQAWGLDLIVADQNDRAQQVLQDLVQQNPPKPQKAEVLFYLSEILAGKKQVDKAIEAIGEASKLLPDVMLFQSRPGWIYYVNRKYDEAIEFYEQFLKKHESDYRSPATREAVKEARMSLSNVYVLTKRYDDATEQLEKVLDEFPADVGALNDLGYLYADQNVHLERALRMVQIASTAEPDNEAYRDSLGWALFRLGKYELAVQELRKAAEIANPDGIILDHLGDALLQHGDTEAALKMWRKALDHLSDDSEDLRIKIIEKIENPKATKPE